jgi:hypothetical protein
MSKLGAVLTLEFCISTFLSIACVHKITQGTLHVKPLDKWAKVLVFPEDVCVTIYLRQPLHVCIHTYLVGSIRIGFRVNLLNMSFNGLD